jgi:DNA-binding CsgD family transcriptional regulator
MEELDRNEAHRKAQWLAYQKHLAEVEELRALEQAYEQAAQEVLSMRAQLIDARLDSQRAELVWHALHLTQQTQLLDSFRGELRTIIGEVTNPLQIIRQIRERLKTSPCEMIDWTAFDAEFRSTYPEFRSKLVARYPELTGVEMRVCELLKVKVVPADIGTLLCISERRVREHRNRIRTKMGLIQGEDVHIVLATI